jgi:DNA-binding response OmpR family regulator
VLPVAVQIQPLRIAVVEDEPFLKDMLVRHLRSTGHTVVWTASEIRRLATRTESNRPDLVIMDLGLADARGAVDVRSVLGSFPAPVVVWTGYRLASARRVLDGLTCVAGVLRKDMDFEELDRVIDGIAGLRGVELARVAIRSA